MHGVETLRRMNDEWPNPLTHRERKAAAREAAISNLETRLGVEIDRDDPMAGAMAQMELALTTAFARRLEYRQ
jgi:hypothetical protein